MFRISTIVSFKIAPVLLCPFSRDLGLVAADQLFIREKMSDSKLFSPDSDGLDDLPTNTY